MLEKALVFFLSHTTLGNHYNYFFIAKMNAVVPFFWGGEGMESAFSHTRKAVSHLTFIEY